MTLSVDIINDHDPPLPSTVDNGTALYSFVNSPPHRSERILLPWQQPSYRINEVPQNKVLQPRVPNLTEPQPPIGRLNRLRPQPRRPIFRPLILILLPVNHVGRHPPEKLGPESLPHLVLIVVDHRDSLRHIDVPVSLSQPEMVHRIEQSCVEQLRPHDRLVSLGTLQPASVPHRDSLRRVRAQP